MRRPFALMLLAMLLPSCSPPFTANDGPVRLRVYNDSDRLFEEVVVNGVAFGDVPAGEFSDYRDFGRLYHYGAVQLRSAGRAYSLIPIDYVGETPLAAGRYTYVLAIEPTSDSLTLEFLVGDELPASRR